jgi:glycosyltransferase involved in cell wall biosynthesis
MLSIVIPTYNEECYLPFLLRSIEAQKYKDYEIVVADAHSTDGTREIATKAGARVVDGGKPGAGRNRGAAVAKGDIILFFDADVILPDPWFLQVTLGEFEKRKLDVATCKIHPMSDKTVDQLFHEVFNYFMWVTSAIRPHAPGFCIFVRRAIHEQIKGFDETITLAEDHDYAMRAGRAGKFGLLKSYRVPVSVRRFDRDGRFNIAVKYLMCELYMRTKGNVTTDMFNYTFGYPKKGKKKIDQSEDGKEEKK